jgi:hypothetical protein
VGVFYADSAGVWRLAGNLTIGKSSGTTTSLSITVASSIVAKSTENQAISSAVLNVGVARVAVLQAVWQTNGAIIVDTVASAAFNSVNLSFDIELNAEPTTYTTAVNMEGAVNVDVYIPPASAGVAGLVNTGAQSFAGNKTLTGFTSFGGDVALKCKKITGTTAAAEGGGVNIAHGLTSSKILGAHVLVALSADDFLPPSYTYEAKYLYNYVITASNVLIYNSPSSSGFILSKPVSILIWYVA